MCPRDGGLREARGKSLGLTFDTSSDAVLCALGLSVTQREDDFAENGSGVLGLEEQFWGFILDRKYEIQDDLGPVDRYGGDVLKSLTQ